MRKVYDLFFEPGEVTELRALGLRGANRAWEGRAGGKGGTVSGYFDDGDKLAQAAKALDDAGARGVYFVINPCKEVLLSRASNRLICPQEDTTTTDQHIKQLRWFLIDIDAKLIDGSRRPKGVSASDAELAVCEETAKNVAIWLEQEIGFARAIRAFSGNGYHLNYKLPDLPNDDTHRMLTKNMMAGLAAKFGDDIDVSVVNPARIWKYYGTTGRKGDSTEERPHRKSFLFAGQPEKPSDIPVTSIELIGKLAALAPSPASHGSGAPGYLPAPSRQGQDAGPSAPPGAETRRIKKSELGPVDMERYLSAHGISFNVKATQDATLYRLEKCIFNADHGQNEAAIVVPTKGAIKYQCFHDSCKSEKRTWKDARKVISGDKSIAEFCQGYDPNWQPPKETGSGLLDNLPIEPVRMMELWRAGMKATLPTPLAIDPREFYEKRGRRPAFVPGALVRYLGNYLYPLRHTNGLFYQYRSGVWDEITKHEIGQLVVYSMKDKIQAAWIENTINILARMVNLPEQCWPDHPLLLNVQNGMVDMNGRKLVAHDPDFGSRTQLPVGFDPKAHAPRWLKFLKDVFPEDENMGKQFLLQQFFGYCLLKDCRYQKALFMYGTGANGKDTVLNVLQAMLGPKNVSNMTLSDLTQRFKASYLQNKLVNLSTETNTRDPIAMDMFKAVVGGGTITTERKYGEEFSFRPFCKFIAAMNTPPTIPDKSYGFTRRVIALYFRRRLEPHEIIGNMSELLIEEITGIFKWAMEGWSVLLSQGGFTIPEQVEEDTAAMITTLNPMLIFIQECCELIEKVDESTTEIWQAYLGWCTEGRNRPLGRNNFYDQLTQTFPSVKKIKAKDLNVFRGIQLNEKGREYAAAVRKRATRYDDHD